MKAYLCVRRATGDDAEEIARLSGELGYVSSAREISARLASLLPLPTQFIAVAVGPDRLLGWVEAERRMLLESGEKAEIVGLVVGAEARRSGVGSALVLAAERWASSQGLKTIVVRSNVVRLESHPFYEGIGYARKKTQHSYSKVLPGNQAKEMKMLNDPQGFHATPPVASNLEWPGEIDLSNHLLHPEGQA